MFFAICVFIAIFILWGLEGKGKRTSEVYKQRRLRSKNVLPLVLFSTINKIISIN